MPSQRDIGGMQADTIRNLNHLSHLIGRFQKLVLDGTPRSAQPTDLDPGQSLIWSGNLSQALSDVTCVFRDNLIKAEPIQEAIPWPEPNPLKDDHPQLPDDDVWQTIQMTVSMERETFRMMTERYPRFGQIVWDRKPCDTIHDLLNEILLNTNTFINTENNNTLKPDPVTTQDPPDAHAPPVKPTQRSIITLEHGLRRYLQVHMQIATLIPAHLRKATQRKFRDSD